MFIIALFAITTLLLPLFLTIALVCFNIIDVKSGNRKNLIPCYLVPFGICLFLSFIGYSIGTARCYYKEIWNFKVDSIKHETVWTTEESETVEVLDGVDSEGYLF